MKKNNNVSSGMTDENSQYQLIKQWELDGTQEVQRLGISKMIDTRVMSVNKGYWSGPVETDT